MAVGSFYPDITGGATQVETLIKQLQDSYDFLVFSGCSNASSEDFGVYKDIKIYRARVRVKGLFQRLNTTIKIMIGYLRLRQEYDILHVHGFTQMNVTLAILARLTGKKIVYSVRTAGHDDPFSVANSSLGKFKKLFFSLADRIICVSPGLYNLSKIYGIEEKRLFLIPNGVDITKYVPVKDECEKSSLRNMLQLPSLDYKIIIYVGYMKKDKGFHLLLEAWLRLKGKFPHVKILTICPLKGNLFEEDYFKEITYFLKEKGISEDIQFIGNTFEIEKYFKASDIFILPSYKEGMPNALLEAMATGLCCIVTQLPGATDFLIQDGINGFLFDKGDSENLANKLKTILRDNDLLKKVGFNSRKFVACKYDIINISKKYTDFYDSLYKA